MNNSTSTNLRYVCFALLSLIIASCGKDSKKTQVSPQSTAKKLGVYEIDSAGYRELLMNISKIGTHAVDYDLIFDTGSGGMVIDANGVLPASMITGTGFNFTGDSTVVDGITITNQTTTIRYGDDNSTTSTVYGNLAYAPVTVGDEKGNIVVKRLPFLLYYKAINSQGNLYGPHEFDVFGVSSQYDITFPDKVFLTSPFNYYDPGEGLIKGFKLAALGTSHFSKEGTYEPVITLGLTQADLNSGFFIEPLVNLTDEGYLPVVVGNVEYVVYNVTSEIVFDTGTSPYSIIEDPNGPAGALLKPNSNVYITTTAGFKYNYVVTADQNKTAVENPAASGSYFTILGLDFFVNNEYLLDLQNHQVGIKNN